jgi:hypothetical protein
LKKSGFRNEYQNRINNLSKQQIITNMKGKTNNPNGRPVGSPNKTTAEIKSLITDFVGRNINTLQTDFEALDPKDRLAFFEKLLPYVIAKQREIAPDEAVLYEPTIVNAV